jgi:hypothetical protein
MDEPEEVVFELRKIASKRTGKAWAAVAAGLAELEERLRELNEPA